MPGRGGQPGARPGRYALARPGVERVGIRVLGAFLGQVEVAGDADRRGEHPGPLATVRVGDRLLDGGHSASSGRTSTAPSMIGSSLPMAIAASRSVVSTTKKPAITSLLSMNGPSVTMPFLR